MDLPEPRGGKPQPRQDGRTPPPGPAYIRTSQGQRGGRIYYTSTAVMDWLQSLPVTKTTN